MLSLTDTVALVEGVDLPSQKLLRRVMYETIYHKKASVRLKSGEDAADLIAAGLLIHIDEPEGVVLPPEFERVRRKLYTYLGRRNESEPYFDPDAGAMKEIPQGASFEAAVALSGETALTLSFPDDEVTDLLNRYGVNRCRGWAP